MTKVGLAKMLGLSPRLQQSVGKWELYELTKFEYQTIEVEFYGDITVEIFQEDLAEDKLNIKLSDLEKEEDIKYCVKQVEDLIWERASDEYLGKIKSLVETIKV